MNKSAYLSKFINGKSTSQVANLQKQMTELLVDNLKLVQINNRLITHIKVLSSKNDPKLEEYTLRVAKLESDLNDIMF